MHFCYRQTIRLRQENFSYNNKTIYTRTETKTLQLHADLSVYFRNGHNRWILYPEGLWTIPLDFPFESARFDSVQRR